MGVIQESIRRVLAVGQNICLRGEEKGYDNLLRLAEEFPITVVGQGNERIRARLVQRRTC